MGNRNEESVPGCSFLRTSHGLFVATDARVSTVKSRSNAIRRTVDALASRGDEGRAKLRKAWGSCTEAVISGCPNGETRRVARPVSPQGRPTRGTETSQYPEEKKSTEILLVAVSERGRGQTRGACSLGVVGPQHGMYDARVKRRGIACQRG